MRQADKGKTRGSSKNTAHSFTKETLFIALCRMIEKKPFDQITIKELTDAAGVSRTTFYRNYNDIEDVLIDYFREHPFGAFSPESYEPEHFSLIKCLSDSFTELKEHRTLWTSLIAADNGVILFRLYDELIRTICIERAFDIGFREEYEIAAFIGMYFSICQEWIKGGMKESVREMVRVSYNIIHTFYKNDEYAFPARDDVYRRL